MTIESPELKTDGGGFDGKQGWVQNPAIQQTKNPTMHEKRGGGGGGGAGTGLSMRDRGRAFAA